MPLRANASTLAELQDAIDKIEGVSRTERKVLPFGVPAIDGRLPYGGLAYGAIHEIGGGGSDTVVGASSALFTAGIAARTTGKVLWCLTRTDLFPPALAQAGLDPNRVIFVESDNELGVCEAFEEALRFGGLAAVVAEMVRLPMDISRRSNWWPKRPGLSASSCADGAGNRRQRISVIQPPRRPGGVLARLPQSRYLSRVSADRVGCSK